MGLRFAMQDPTKNKVRSPGIGYGKIGNLTTTQLSDPGAGFGPTFLAAARQAGTEAIKGAESVARPEDIAAQTQLRDFYTSSLSGLGEAGDRRNTAFDTQMQTGLDNLLGQYKRSRAGSGVIGSAQYDRGTGDIVNKLAQEYTRGVNDISGQQLKEASGIGAGLADIYGQDLQERQFQSQQAQALANWLQGQQQLDLSRDSQLAGIDAQRDAQKQALWGGIASSVLGGLGSLYGGGMLGGAPGKLMGAQTAYYNKMAGG